MKGKCICPVCNGTGEFIPKEECWGCGGEGMKEVEMLNEKSIRNICNSIQELLEGTNIFITDNEIMNILNKHKRD